MKNRILCFAILITLVLLVTALFPGLSAAPSASEKQLILDKTAFGPRGFQRAVMEDPLIFGLYLSLLLLLLVLLVISLKKPGPREEGRAGAAFCHAPSDIVVQPFMSEKPSEGDPSWPAGLGQRAEKETEPAEQARAGPVQPAEATKSDSKPAGGPAAGIDHDFNDLLFVISGNIALAKLEIKETAKALTRLTEAQEACRQAKDLVLDLVRSGRVVAQGELQTRKRILVMDEAMPVREVIGAMLSYLGYDVAYAEDGRAAVDLYKNGLSSGEPFSAVILELTVKGGMGAGKALQMMRIINPSVKAIVSSAYSDDPAMLDFEKLGFEAAIAKPYDMEELGEILERLIP